MSLGKAKIIRKYGTDVSVFRYTADRKFDERLTRALLGRGTRNNTNMRTLQSQKEGIFLPQFDIQGGDFVENLTTSEMYVVSGTHQEYYKNSILSHVCNLLKCNNKLTVKGNIRIADNRGNLRTEFGDKHSEVPCYFQEVGSELKQYEPGIHPDTEYRIYTANIEMDETDQIEVEVYGKTDYFKVNTKDYVTFPGMVVIEVTRDIRK